MFLTLHFRPLLTEPHCPASSSSWRPESCGLDHHHQVSCGTHLICNCLIWQKTAFNHAPPSFSTAPPLRRHPPGPSLLSSLPPSTDVGEEASPKGRLGRAASTHLPLPESTQWNEDERDDPEQGPPSLAFGASFETCARLSFRPSRGLSHRKWSWGGEGKWPKLRET